MGASSSSVREALEAENDRVLAQAALDPEPLIGDVFLPVSPEAVREALVVEKGIKFLKKVDPDRYPGNLNGMKDSWAVGRSGNWICRYHCVPRRRMYTPTAGSLVPYLPEEAFTGVRVTYLDQGGHELWDDFRLHPRQSLVHTDWMYMARAQEGLWTTRVG